MSEEKETPEEGKEKPSEGTSADVVKGEWQKHHKKLETRISVLEDTNKTLREQNEAFTKQFEALKTMPSKTNPARSLWDELNDFVFIPQITDDQMKSEKD